MIIRSWRCLTTLAAIATLFGSARGGADEGGTGSGSVLDTLSDFRDFDEIELSDLLNFTVTIAAGKAQTLEQAPSIVSVITDRQLRRTGQRTVEEALEQVPGIALLRGSDGRDRIAIRGVTSGITSSSSESVLVLFNGHRLNQEASGGATVHNLDFPVDNVQKVEIIRGPGAARYGANAFLGVINIVGYTHATFDGLEVSAGRGSFAAQEYNVNFGKELGKLSAYGFLRYADTDGARVLIPVDGQTGRDQILRPFGVPPASLAPGRTSDDRRSFDANFTLGYENLTVNGRYKDEEAGAFVGILDNLAPRSRNRLDSSQLALDAGYALRLGQSTDIRAQLSYTRSISDQFFQAFPPGFAALFPDGRLVVFPDGFAANTRIGTRRLDGELVVDRQLGANNQVTAGIEYGGEATFGQDSQANFDPMTRLPVSGFVRAPNVVKDTDRRLFSLFLQDTWNPLPALGLTGGVRWDHYNDFGNTANPRAGAVLRLPHDLHLKLLYGRAFRAPSFTELFFTFPGYAGNPALKPTTINTYEVELGYKRRNLRISANVYANALRDTIVISAIDVAGTAGFTNIAGINARGIELGAHRTFGTEHELHLGYAYQNSRDKTTGNRTAGIPIHLGHVGATIGLFRHLSVTPTLFVRGSVPREAMIDPRAQVASFAVANVNVVAKDLFGSLSLSAMVGNVFDKLYSDPSPAGGVPRDYPRPGRSVFVKATWRLR